MINKPLFLNAPAERTALVREDGTELSYGSLESSVMRFAERLDHGRGLLLLETGDIENAIVAFLGGLAASCPVFLIAGEQPGENLALRQQFSFLYRYDSKTDTLACDTAVTGLDIHPDLAVMLSTSGSTGTAKSVKLSRENIHSNALSIAEYLELTPDDRAPTVLPFHYSYGMSVVTSHLAAGASLFLTERSVLEAEFWAAFDEHKCTSFAGVPHTFELLEKSQFRTADRPNLRYVTQAGGRLPPEQVASLASRAREEGWHFFVMYGQTEAAPRIAYLPPDLAEEHPDCIGMPIPGGALLLETDNGEEITGPDQTGELVYRGPNVMMGYALSDTDLSAGNSLTELHTGDLAQRTPKGLFRIVGRKSRFIKPFGLRISLDEVENRLASRAIEAAAGGNDNVLGVLITDHSQKERVQSDLADWLGLPAHVVKIAVVEEIPRNDSGKIDGNAVNALLLDSRDEQDWGDRLVHNMRSALGRLGLFANSSDAPENTVLEIFQTQFPGQRIKPEHSFVDAGGDSLSYLEVALSLEEILGPLPERWELMPISELEARHKSSSPVESRIETQTLLRFLSIVLVVSGHLDFIEYGGGGALTLLAVAGFSFSMFQIPAIIENGSTNSVIRLLVQVAVPTIIYLCLMSLLFFEFDLRVVMLYSNWIDPHLAGNAAAWFVDVYVQLMLFFAVIFLVPAVRRMAGRDAFFFWFALLVFAIVLFAVAHQFWDTRHLYRRLPHMMLWIFTLGAAAQVSSTTSHRILLTAAFIIADLLWKGVAWRIGFFEIAMLLLIWVPSIEISQGAKRIINGVASASLFIYLTHFQSRSAISKVYDGGPGAHVLAALIIGMLLWHFYSTLLRLAGTYLVAFQRR